MKNMTTCLAALFLLVSGACRADDIDEPSTVLTLDVDETEEVFYSDFIADVDYIKLSTDGDAFIGTIEKIEVYNERLYVLDARNSIGLFVYNLQRELLYKIQNYGREPGEFMGPYDFAIDEQEQEIIIYDARDLKLCFYNLKDGTFLREVNLDFRFGRFTSFDGGFIFFLNNIVNSGEGYNIVITDKDLNIIDRKIRMKPGMQGYVFSLVTNFTKNNEYIYFTAPADYQIYAFNKGTGEISTHCM